MKIIFEAFESIFDFAQINFAELVVENPNLFYNICSDLICLKNGETGVKIHFLKDEIQEISFEKECELIYDFFNLNYDDKKDITAVQKKIVAMQKDNDYFVELSNINQTINQFAKRIETEIDLPITIESNYSFEELIKILKIHSVQDTSLQLNLINYIEFELKLKKFKLIIFVNLISVLTKEQICELIKYCNYNELKVLFLNSYDIGLKIDKKVIIDNDLCEI